ncbi:hypothetical protein [Methanobrevibacter sp.]|jgi:hypothetical protein|uniref:hypothetical protein n=1 Tax=Methanobrevibacter sp. TaxID=66852 RepID=UPI00386DFE1E
MSELKIILEDEIGRDLGQRSKIEEIFTNISPNVTKVIMDFKNIEFMGRSFAQEYLNQKHFASFEVIEENVPEDVEKMFDMILKLNNRK